MPAGISVRKKDQSSDWSFLHGAVINRSIPSFDGGTPGTVRPAAAGLPGQDGHRF